MIIVHPNDKTTDFLKILYEGSKLDETSSNSKIEEELKKAKEIMLLGHGTEYGLLAPQGKEQFGRLIINSRHVQFLRNKIIIGLWCNANIFAMKYNLTGLFSGMVISEVGEALDWLNFIPSQEDIEESRNRWVTNLNKIIKENKLQDVPRIMKRLEGKDEIENFNNQSLFYFENGMDIDED